MRVWMLSVFAAAAPGFAVAQVSFQALPPLVSNYSSGAYGLSGDGRSVLGEASVLPPGSASGRRAVMWRDGAVHNLGNISGDASAWASTYDGEIAVGWASLPGGGQQVAAQYAGGLVIPLTNYTTGQYATSISANGLVVAGLAGYGTSLGFRLENQTTYTALQPLVGHSGTYGWGVTADGSTIVGTSAWDASSINPGRAVVWNEAGQPSALALLPGFTHRSEARDVSPDGSAIVGLSLSTGGAKRATMWLGGAPMNLGALEPAPTGTIPMSEAIGVSAGGGAVVGVSGHSSSTSGHIANPRVFLWTQELGMVNLKDYLTGLGLDLSGWTLVHVAGISDDGRVIAGNGISPTGASRAWVAVIPSPAVSALGVFGVIGACIRRRRRE